MNDKAIKSISATHLAVAAMQRVCVTMDKANAYMPYAHESGVMISGHLHKP